MAYTIKGTLDNIPSGRVRGSGTTDTVDYTDEIALIEQIPEGKVLEIEFGDHSEFRAFSSRVRAAGRRVNKTVEATFKKGRGENTNSVYLTYRDGYTKTTRTRRPKAEEVAA